MAKYPLWIGIPRNSRARYFESFTREVLLEDPENEEADRFLWRPSTKAMSVYVTHIFSGAPAERVDKFNLQFGERRLARTEKMKLNRWIKTLLRKNTLNVSWVLTNSHDCIFQLFAIIHLYNITEIVAKNWN